MSTLTQDRIAQLCTYLRGHRAAAHIRHGGEHSNAAHIQLRFVTENALITLVSELATLELADTVRAAITEDLTLTEIERARQHALSAASAYRQAVATAQQPATTAMVPL
jgi:hypothetical protein